MHCYFILSRLGQSLSCSVSPVLSSFFFACQLIMTLAKRKWYIIVFYAMLLYFIQYSCVYIIYLDKCLVNNIPYVNYIVCVVCVYHVVTLCQKYLIFFCYKFTSWIIIIWFSSSSSSLTPFVLSLLQFFSFCSFFVNEFCFYVCGYGVKCLFSRSVSFLYNKCISNNNCRLAHTPPHIPLATIIAVLNIS